MFAFANVCVVDEEAIAAAPDLGYGIGTGPYKIVEWTLGDQTVVERFDDYFGELPKTKRFVFKLITEDTSRVIALDNGEIDLCMLPVPAVTTIMLQNRLLKEYGLMQQMTKQVSKMTGKGKKRRFGKFPGMGGGMPGLPF